MEKLGNILNAIKSTYHNLWVAAKTIPRGKIVALKNHKLEKKKMHVPHIPLKKLEKEQPENTEESKRREIRCKQTERGRKHTLERINRAPVGSLVSQRHAA